MSVNAAGPMFQGGTMPFDVQLDAPCRIGLRNAFACSDRRVIRTWSRLRVQSLSDHAFLLSKNSGATRPAFGRMLAFRPQRLFPVLPLSSTFMVRPGRGFRMHGHEEEA